MLPMLLVSRGEVWQDGSTTAYITSCASQNRLGARPGAQPELLPRHQPVHDALQDGGERGDADAGADEDGVLRGEDPPCRGPVGSVNVALGETRHGENSRSPWVLETLLGCRWEQGKCAEFGVFYGSFMGAEESGLGRGTKPPIT